MRLLLLLLLQFYQTNTSNSGSFINEQQKYERVKMAIREKENPIRANLQKFGLTPKNLNLAIVVYKEEDTLELYGKAIGESKYKLIESYKICTKSGTLGPKRKQGDNQVPEGYYHISRFNPVSSYYLSLMVNYPNESDKIKSGANDPGGDIFIHGKCVTIGCLPMTDQKIKEIYLYAAYARGNGQMNIPVYIFPFKLNDENIEKYSNIYSERKDLVEFWQVLGTGYRYFQKNRIEIDYGINKEGNYFYNFND